MSNELQINPKAVVHFRKEWNLSRQDLVDLVDRKTFTIENLEQLETTGKGSLRKIEWVASALDLEYFDFFLEDIPKSSAVEFRTFVGSSVRRYDQLSLNASKFLSEAKKTRETVKALGAYDFSHSLKDLKGKSAAYASTIFREIFRREYPRDTGGKDAPKLKLERLRRVVEEFGVLTFLTSNYDRKGIALTEFRGCLLDFDELPIIVINKEDNHNAGAFTLLHEFAHILCPKSLDEKDKERWCDTFAAEVVIPEKQLRSWYDSNNVYQGEELITAVSAEFVVSRMCAAVGLTKLGLIEWRRRADFYEAPKSRAAINFGIRRQAVTIKHTPFTLRKMVWRGYLSGRLGLSDIANLTGIRGIALNTLERNV